MNHESWHVFAGRGGPREPQRPARGHGLCGDLRSEVLAARRRRRRPSQPGKVDAVHDVMRSNTKH